MELPLAITKEAEQAFILLSNICKYYSAQRFKNTILIRDRHFNASLSNRIDPGWSTLIQAQNLVQEGDRAGKTE